MLRKVNKDAAPMYICLLGGNRWFDWPYRTGCGEFTMKRE